MFCRERASPVIYRLLDGQIVPISLGAIKVLALVDWAELEEAQAGAALGTVAA